MLRPILFLLLAAPLAVRAAAPLADPAPLVTPPPPAPGERLITLATAQRMLETGFPSVAAGAFEKLLAAPETPAADRDALVLDLVSARLNEGDPVAAEKALQRYAGPHNAAWHLRAGLIAAGQKGPDAVRKAQAELTAINPVELTAGEQAWVYFLKGRLADAAGDFVKALAFYKQAADGAESGFQRALFVEARELARLKAGDVSEDMARDAKKRADDSAGQGSGYAAAYDYAVDLYALGHKAEAAAYLLDQLHALPPAAREARDDFRLLLGLVATAQEGAGRDALESLLADSDKSDYQRAALQLLAAASGEGVARQEFYGKLTALISTKPDHPILDDLLLLRAQLDLADNQFVRAEAGANALLARSPGSQLAPAALGTLMGVAWEQRRPRQAAVYAEKARAVTTGELHAELGVLKAEALFRAGEVDDYKNAAAAYAEALKDPPVGVTTGELIFQQVLAEIRAGSLDEAGRRLDSYADDARLDSVNRWQAEWNLAHALRATGPDGVKLAYARVNALLGTALAPGAELTGGLHAKMAWLQAMLALDADTPERASALAQGLRDALPRMTGLDEKLRDGVTLHDEVAAGAGLLQARASFALHTPQGDETALALLEAVRTDFPLTDAAMRSYLEAADYFASPGRDQIVKAEELLQQLADTEIFPDDYKSAALYQKALLEERRDQPENFVNALAILDHLLDKYRGSELEFYARLKQGLLNQKLARYSEAELIFDSLVNDFASHSYANLAKMAQADCDYAQVAAGDPKHYSNALTRYENLHYQQDVSPDMRAEAGYKQGDLLELHGNKTEAAGVWLGLAIDFLPDNPAKPVPSLGPDGREWIDRALIHCGELLAEGGEAEKAQARKAYAIDIQRGLRSAALARDLLDRLGGGPVAK